MRSLRNVFAHLSIVFAGVFVTLTILNQYNPAMGFLTSKLTSVFIILFCLWVVVLSVATIADNRKYAAHMRVRAEEKARARKADERMQRPPRR
jgi:uncharacterized membrane protein